jgi:hypothetical protein
MPPFEQLERPRFFTARLLTATDLEQEQAYFLGRARRHNRFLHGWGIVSGLGVAIEDGTTVVVAAGLALDCAGNELVLAAPERLSLAGLSGKHYVTIRYLEILAAQRPSRQGRAGAVRARARSGASAGLRQPGCGAQRHGLGQRRLRAGACAVHRERESTRLSLAGRSREAQRPAQTMTPASRIAVAKPPAPSRAPEDKAAFWSRGASGLLAELNSGSQGLSSAEAGRRLHARPQHPRRGPDVGVVCLRRRSSRAWC